MTSDALEHAPGTRQAPRPRWHYVYSALAALGVCAVGTGLYLTQELIGIYRYAIEANHVWAERAEKYSRLGELAAAVNAPGNNVFETRAPAAEERRMRTALEAFDRSLAARREELRAGVDPALAGPLLVHLDEAAGSMQAMVDEAERMFADLRAGRAESAGARMASMDGRYAAVNGGLARLRLAVAGIQRGHLDRQSATAHGLQRYRIALGLLILLTFAAATIYGRRLAREMRADADEKRRHLDLVSQAARRQGLIAAFGQKALDRTHLDELLEHAVALVREALDVEFCEVLRLAADGRSLSLAAGCGWKKEWIEGRARHIELGAQRFAQCPDECAPVLVQDLSVDGRFAGTERLRAHGIASGIEVAVAGALGPCGVLGVFSRRPGRFTAEDVHFLQSIANALGSAIERSGSDERLSYLAQFDSLTGLPNRTLVRDRLGQVLTQAQRTRHQAGVIFIDLDGFKPVNDNYGHGAGDELLKRVAERLKQCVRAGDTVGRLAGDEFAIVLSALARAEDARLVAQKVVAALTSPFQVDGHAIRVSASLGIALYPGDGETVDTLLKHADSAMYSAKAQGRNTYRFYRPKGPTPLASFAARP